MTEPIVDNADPTRSGILGIEFKRLPGRGRMHGLNERIRIRSVYEGRSFLYQLVKIYAEQ